MGDVTYIEVHEFISIVRRDGAFIRVHPVPEPFLSPVRSL
jgi:hypothetical protein